MRRTAAASLVALVVAVALLAFPSPGPARAGSPCSPWPTSYGMPETIRVLRTASGTVETVPFQAYVENVMSWEWPASYPTEALRVGALAVKQYGLYYVVNPRSNPSTGYYMTGDGECYHVRDDTWDQLYRPQNSNGTPRVPAASQVAAVEATWDMTMRRGTSFFLPHYFAGESNVCGAKAGRRSVTWLPQSEVKACAQAGMSMAEVLHLYLDPDLSIAAAVRRFGGDRYATAVAISRADYGPSTGTVYVARGLDFPDALAAGPVAARDDAPILLVADDGVPDVVAEELARLAPERIVVLGGPGAVPEAVVAQLGQTGAEVTRVAGADRYETAVAISASAFDPGVPLVFVATGRNFPDALAGSAAGAHLGAPVLLVPGDTIPAVVVDELTRLTPGAIRVLGGAAAVSDEVVGALAAFSPDVARLAGSDRYQTAAAVSASAFEPGVERVRIATGANFPDALAAAALGRPILLVGGSAPAATIDEAVRLAPSLLEPVGGPAVVSDGTVTSIVRSAGRTGSVPAVQ
jgi:putative cell wall-binding protein